MMESTHKGFERKSDNLDFTFPDYYRLELYHLAFALGKNNTYLKKLKSGSEREITKYTSQFYNSKGIRKEFSKEEEEFMINTPHYSLGDLVLVKDTCDDYRIKILYKNYEKVYFSLADNLEFNLYMAIHNAPVFNKKERDCIIRPGFKRSELKAYLIYVYEKNMKKDYFNDLVRFVFQWYNEYRRKTKLPTIDTIYKRIHKEELKKAKSLVLKGNLTEEQVKDCIDILGEQKYNDIKNYEAEQMKLSGF